MNTSKVHLRGFTLMEVLIAIVILMLLCGSLFGILSATVKNSVRLKTKQRQADTIRALDNYLETLVTRPESVQILSLSRHHGIVLGDGAAYTVLESEANGQGGWVLVRQKLDPAGLSTDPDSKDFPTITEVEDYLQGHPDQGQKVILLDDLRSIVWQFSTGSIWQDNWNDSDHRPAVISLSLGLSERTEPVVMNFWVPALTQPKLVGAN